MNPKIIKYEEDARTKLKKGVDTVANAVKVTLGPRGRNVLINKKYGIPHVTKDGISVANEIFLKDEFEDMGAQMIKQAAQKTCDEAGDGTTSCTVLAQEIYNSGLKFLTAGHNPIVLKRGMDKAVSLVVDKINQMAKPIKSVDEVAQVGTISANDEELGSLIAELLDKTGKDGIITIEESQKELNTSIEFSEGMNFDRGYFSPYFATIKEDGKAFIEFKNPYILLIDGRFENIQEAIGLIEEIHKEGRQLLIIAEDFGDLVISTLIQNTLKGSFTSCAVKAPGFGERRKEILKDLATLIGGAVVGNDAGVKLSDITVSDLGSSDKVLIDRKSTTIISAHGNPEEIKDRVNQIKDDINNVDLDYDKEKMRERLAKLVGGVGIIKVGAATETELKEKKDRVEDAVHATRASLEEGIVTGGGIALIRCIPVVDELIDNLKIQEEKDGALIIRNALDSPLRQIVYNCGDKPDVVIDNVLNNKSDSFGYNAYSRKFENLLDAGVIDPAKVVRCSLQNACSVSSMLLTTEAVICDDLDDTGQK